jgi:hypothetical protein
MKVWAKKNRPADDLSLRQQTIFWLSPIPFKAGCVPLAFQLVFQIENRRNTIPTNKKGS